MRRGNRVAWRHWLIGALAAAWCAAGLFGAFDYLNNYSQHRGFAVLRRAPGVRPGRQLWVHFYSPALHRRFDYLVYLPNGYTPARRYPVFYLLHGLPGRPQAYIRIASIDALLDNLISAGRIPPMLLVFPDGRINGDTMSDSEWANTPAGNFDDYVIDVVNDVDHRFSAIPSRTARVIAGYSAGAYGALNIALHHLAVFGSVQVWSGYFVQSRSGVFAHASEAELLDNSPYYYVAQVVPLLRSRPLRVFIYSGRDDRNSRQAAPMTAVLRRAGADARYAIYSGGHDWALWHGHLAQMLELAGRDVTAPPPTRPLRRHRRHARRHLGRHRHPRGHRRHTRHHARPRAHRHARRHARRHRTLTAAGPLSPTAASLHRSASASLLGLLLALVSAAAINLGFLLQQRGLRAAVPTRAGPWTLLRSALRSRAWVGGQALGSAGFAAQIAAVAIAPLALVQAFAAGGLALSVPLAAMLFAYRIERREAVAVLVVAASLAALPIGLGAGHDRLGAGTLLILTFVLAALGLAAAARPSAASRALAAGLFYGIADAAIKAIAVRWHADGLLSPWTVVALLGTFAGFLSFQSALRIGSAVTGISLMSALAALVALCCGLLAFGEALGTTPGATAVHSLAILLVLATVPVLAGAQTEIAEARPASRQHAGEREHQPLGPRTEARTPREQHVAEAHVAGNGKRSLREEQEQRDAEEPGKPAAPSPPQPHRRYAGHDTGR